MSQQERVSWVSLVVNVLIGYWYFETVLSLPPGADLFGPRMAGFAIQLVILSIIISVACEIALRMLQKQSGGDDAEGRVDERDRLINLKASRNGHGVLSLAIIIVVSQIAVLEWVRRLGRHRFDPQSMLDVLVTGPLAPMHIVQLLLLALTLGAITVYASRIFYYRRGY
jgi:hypothetical protein